MQNKYVGDIGDYSKFILIKHLFDKKVGLIWYLYPDEDNNDGCHIDYQNYKLKDKQISKMLMEVICENRSIEYLEKKLKTNGFDLEFFNECIESKDCKFLDYKKRESRRKEWFSNALKKIKNCDVVFVDPDNGIEPDSCRSENKRKQIKKCGKYIFFDEIDELLKNHKILVIYQHFVRKNTDDFIDELFRKLKNNIENSFNFYALKFKKRVPRTYLILSKDYLQEKITKFCNEFEDEFELLKAENG